MQNDLHEKAEWNANSREEVFEQGTLSNKHAVLCLGGRGTLYGASEIQRHSEFVDENRITFHE